MFSAKTTAVLVLRAKSLEFYNGKEQQRESLQFPPKILKKDEIVDWEKFELLIEEFLARNSVKKQHAILVLAKDIIFEKTIPAGDAEKEKAEEEKFFKTIHYDEKDIVTKRFRDGDNIYLISTYKDFYQSVKYTFEKFGWVIEQVIPMSMFEDFDADKMLDYAEVNQILSHTDLLKVGDMTSDADTIKPSRLAQTQQVQEQNSGLFSKQNLVLLFSIAVFCGGVFFAILYFNIIKLPVSSFSFAPTPTPSPIPTSTPTPLPSFDTSAASVKVLNGTGTPGQAGKVKTVMTGLGFSDVSTDNANSKTTTTLVVFSAAVPQNIQDEIVATLKKTFTTISSNMNKTAATDITITTGEEK